MIRTGTDPADVVVKYAMHNEVCPLEDAQACRDAFEAMREALSVAVSDYDQWGETWQDSDCQCDKAGDCSHGAIGKARAALALADKVSR